MLLSTLSLVAYSSVFARTKTSPATKTITPPLPSLTAVSLLDLPQYEKFDRIKIKKQADEEEKKESSEATKNKSATKAVPTSHSSAIVRSVPFYSQFTDISKTSWQKVGCGIASLGMLIDYYKPAVSIDTLLNEGINAGAYVDSAGWSHAGLISLAKNYGLTGASHGLAHLTMKEAFATLEEAVAEGPVMVSVHYTFEPTNPIPHLVVVTSIENEAVYYNDPAEPNGNGNISVTKFQNAWKKRYIEIRPVS